MYLPLHGVCTFKCVLEMLLFKDLPMQTLLVSKHPVCCRCPVSMLWPSATPTLAT